MVPYSGALVPLSAVQRGNIDHSNGAIYSKAELFTTATGGSKRATTTASWTAINRPEWSYLQQTEAPFLGALVPLSAVEWDNIDNNHGAISNKSSTFLQQSMEMPVSAGDR